MFGRRILHTTLDPIPRNFRAAPGVIALKEIVDIVQAEDAAEVRRIGIVKRLKRPKITSPSSRLAMLAALRNTK